MTKGAGDGPDRLPDVTQPLELQDLRMASIDAAHGTPHEMRHERTEGSARPRVSTSTARRLTCVHLGTRAGVESTCDGREIRGHLQSSVWLLTHEGTIIVARSVTAKEGLQRSSIKGREPVAVAQDDALSACSSVQRLPWPSSMRSDGCATKGISPSAEHSLEVLLGR